MDAQCMQYGSLGPGLEWLGMNSDSPAEDDSGYPGSLALVVLTRTYTIVISGNRVSGLIETLELCCDWICVLLLEGRDIPRHS